MNKKQKDLIITSLLARLTDFELQTQDKALLDWCEDLREYISDYEPTKKE